MSVREERTGWRDESISQRHREWGFDCPAQDIDFLLIEYDKCVVKALFEYKNEHAGKQTRSKPQYKALIDLGNRASIPVFNVRYSDDLSEYIVTALNELAEEKLPDGIRKPPRVLMDELGYVTFLYKLRDREIPEWLKMRIEERSNNE